MRDDGPPRLRMSHRSAVTADASLGRSGSRPTVRLAEEHRHDRTASADRPIRAPARLVG